MNKYTDKNETKKVTGGSGVVIKVGECGGGQGGGEKPIMLAQMQGDIEKSNKRFHVPDGRKHQSWNKKRGGQKQKAGGTGQEGQGTRETTAE